ncbi:hypothetical protein ACMC56_14370 [Campylobacterota bacterium DY0563]
MVKIQNKNLDELVKKYYSKIENYINQSNTKYKLDDINCDLLTLFDKDLEQIISLKPYEQRELIKISPKDFTKNIMQLKDLYEVFRNKWAVELIEDLDIQLCPFCNREYIFRFEDRKSEKARIISTLDHYYDKDTYPFLAVSFYNLIPYCHICNSKFKHSKNFYEIKHLHPYEDDFNKKATFHLKLKDSTFYYDKKGFNLELKVNSNDDELTKNTISTFRLDELYKNHKDIALELIQKAQVYNKSYIYELFQKYEGTLFKNREDVLRHITGGYVEDKDINKRPLSKLIKDISEELDLL